MLTLPGDSVNTAEILGLYVHMISPRIIFKNYPSELFLDRFLYVTDIDLWRRHCDNIILSIEYWHHHYIHMAALYERTFEFLFAFLNK